MFCLLSRNQRCVESATLPIVAILLAALVGWKTPLTPILDGWVYLLSTLWQKLSYCFVFGISLQKGPKISGLNCIMFLESTLWIFHAELFSHRYLAESNALQFELGVLFP